MHGESKKKFQDIKEVIRSSKSKKDKQDNGQMKKGERTNNDPQNITQKTRTPLSTVNSGSPDGQVVPAPHITHVVDKITKSMIGDFDIGR